MPFLEQSEAVRLRTALVEDGFAIVPNVCPPALLKKIQVWSDELLDDPTHPEWEVRFQGDVEFVQTPRAAAKQSKPGAGKQRRASSERTKNRSEAAIIEDLFDLPTARAACAEIGLEHLRSDNETVILLSKFPGAPPLYWHQDLMNWGHASAAAPWPTRVFLSYYTVGTDRTNGCLRAIPGSHRKRHWLHDHLPEAHSQLLASAKEVTSLPTGSPNRTILSHRRFHKCSFLWYLVCPAAALFDDCPDAVDLPMRAGDLIIGDARLLHAAWPNCSSSCRRTCVLAWHNVFKFPNPPSWWVGDIPKEVAEYVSTQDTGGPDEYGRRPRLEAQLASSQARSKL